MGEPIKMASDKIDGFDKWEVESGARTLIEAKEMLNRPKFYAAVKKELVKQAKAVQAAAVEAKAGARLKQAFGKEK